MGLLGRIIEYIQNSFSQSQSAYESDSSGRIEVPPKEDEELLMAQLRTGIATIDRIFEDKDNFIDPATVMAGNENLGYLYSKTLFSYIRKYWFSVKYFEIKNLAEKFNDQYCNLQRNINYHNDDVAKRKIEYGRQLIGTVEGKELDDQQMNSIVRESKNRLVIAGAGTGKTTTIIGRIKYLLATKKCEPRDILVLSFTNASANDMKERIIKETGENIMACTFHKLGMGIINRVEGKVPNITSVQLSKFIKDYFDKNKDTKYYDELTNFILFDFVLEKSEFEFSTLKEYQEYLRINPPKTIKGEVVKSYGEMKIANFLFQNQIEYEYEKPYKVDTNTEEYKQYYPDFYLPKYDIYIEFFGINDKGEVPSFFTGRDGLSATETYKKSMEWKRETHKQYNTKMVEAYAYEYMSGNLLEVLQLKLQFEGVEMSPMTADEINNVLLENSRSVLDGIIELFETLINLIKNNNISFEKFRNMIPSVFWQKRYSVLVELLEPIYKEYELYLEKNDEIDFNDMINKAINYLQDGSLKNAYKYIIVDEYQDISKSRYRLLNELRKSSDYDLFCVGDDWQSIYRFSGSDIGYIVNFGDYWGATDLSQIETTYRFSQQLIDVSGTFIMKNPLQVKKKMKGVVSNNTFPMEIIKGYTDTKAVDFMTEKLDQLPKGSSVYFIGRYKNDIDLIKNNSLFKCKYSNETGFVQITYAKNESLKITYLTAHKSKGLQADYVFILNNKDSKMGFPSKVQSDPVIELLLEKCDVNYPYAEERRLFYVAMTRAKIKVFLLVVDGHESVFVNELNESYKKQLQDVKYECPLCGGRLVKRNGKYGEFFGCSNYSKNGCGYIKNIKIKKEK